MQTLRSQPIPGLVRNLVTTDDGTEVLATYYEHAENITDVVPSDEIAEQAAIKTGQYGFAVGTLLAASFLFGVLLGTQAPQWKAVLSLLAQIVSP